MEDRRVAVVVEDDDDIRDLLVALLGQSGFEVHAAADGMAGVQAVERHDPVLVTVDLGLPDIDGYEVTRRVRRLTDAYVVMLTARDEEIDTLLGLDAGADDYLTKPFRPRVLRARVEAMLRRPRAGTDRSAAPSGTSESTTTYPVPTALPAVPAPDATPPERPSAPSARPDSPATAAPAAPSGQHPASRTPGSARETYTADRGPAPHAPGPAPADALEPASGPAGRTAPPSADPAEPRLHLDGLVLAPWVHHVAADGQEVSLTRTEFTLLETLLRSGRVVRSKTELSRILRGDEPDAGTFVSESDERTVEVHVGNLRRKLGDDPRRPRWIETVRGVGYRTAGSVRTSA